MAVRRISGPTVEPVSLEEAKDHLNFDSDDKDALIGAYISAARAYIENWCHIVVAQAVFELTYDSFPDGAIEIPNPPLIEVESIKYDDGDGVEQTLSTDDYVVDASGKFGWVVPISTGWPSTIDAVNAVRVRYIAGFPDGSGEASSVPVEFKQAILLLVGHYFANREGVGTNTLAALPLAVEPLISPHLVPVMA